MNHAVLENRKMSDPRVRFAPSPTGYLHVGGARTALFNWLFARHHEGTFVLRIEDTDRERSSDEMVRAILDGLAWLGLTPDEGPHHQADGLERHRRDALRLLEAGAAYRCFCDPERARARADAERVEVGRREGNTGGGEATDQCEAAASEPSSGCEGGCRATDPEASEARAAQGAPFALRFKVPEGGTTIQDRVHGEVSFDHDHLEDFVLLRSDGTPVYNLAVVSDDLEMRITHVIRGDDHLSNAPKQVLIYRALGAEPPEFAHVPMILGADGKRLSKRHGALAVDAYRGQGILPAAMVNFLALLGWSPGDDREVMEMDELVAAFSLDRILKKGAVFDPEKLLWLNGQYIARSGPERLGPLVEEALAAEGSVDPAQLEREEKRFHQVLEAVKERPRTIQDLAAQVAPFFADQVEYEEDAVARFWKRPAEAAEGLRALRERLSEVEPWEPEPLEAVLRGLAEELGVGAGKLIHPLRLALMGVGVSPGIFTVLALMGRERTLRRIETALGYLDAKAAAAGA